jgi:flagellar motor protein MotB
MLFNIRRAVEYRGNDIQPIDTNDTADGRSSNRRVVFVIVEQDACEE